MRPALSRSVVSARLACGLFFLGALGLSAGCGKKTSLGVKVYAPGGAADPFASASRIRMALGDKLSEADVSGGKFEVSIELDTPKGDEFKRLLLEAFDSGGALVGRGRTPDFIIAADNFQVGVFVGRPGQVSPTELYTPADLTPGSTSPPLPAALGRTGLTAAALRGRQVSPAEPGYGALIAGGVTETGQHPTSAWLYQTLTHQLIDAGTLGTPRRGAALLPSADATYGQEAVLVGGVGANGAPVSAAEKFSSRVSSKAQLWGAPAADITELTKPGLYQPAVAELSITGGAVPEIVFLVAGGSEDAMGMVPSGQAALVRRFPPLEGSSDSSARPGVKPIAAPMGQAAPMLAGRWRHSATPTSATAALIFGGLTPADERMGKPVAELFSLEKNAFEALALKMPQMMAVPSRRGHVAVRLRSGRVLIAGGYTDDGMGKREVLRSALLVSPTDPNVEVRPTLLGTARYAAAVAAVDNDVVICGGYDATDTPLGDCELLKNEAAGESLEMAAKSIPLPQPRAEAQMLAMENGMVLILGGVGRTKLPVANIDVYLPR